MKTAVYLDYLQSVQIVAALTAREDLLALFPTPDPVVARAMADCISAEFALRAAFDFPSEAQLDAAHEAAMHEMAEFRDAEFSEGLADVPLADWPEADKAGVHGR